MNNERPLAFERLLIRFGEATEEYRQPDLDRQMIPFCARERARCPQLPGSGRHPARPCTPTPRR